MRFLNLIIAALCFPIAATTAVPVDNIDQPTPQVSDENTSQASTGTLFHLRTVPGQRPSSEPVNFRRDWCTRTQKNCYQYELSGPNRCIFYADNGCYNEIDWAGSDPSLGGFKRAKGMIKDAPARSYRCWDV